MRTLSMMEVSFVSGGSGGQSGDGGTQGEEKKGVGERMVDSIGDALEDFGRGLGDGLSAIGSGLEAIGNQLGNMWDRVLDGSGPDGPRQQNSDGSWTSCSQGQDLIGGDCVTPQKSSGGG